MLMPQGGSSISLDLDVKALLFLDFGKKKRNNKVDNSLCVDIEHQTLNYSFGRFALSVL